MDESSEGEWLNEQFDNLWPLTRSITGPGIEESLEILQSDIPLDVEYVPSGTEVFDWEVPMEWRIREARLVGPDGKVYADFDENNLSVINYSEPVDRCLSLEELDPHLYTNPEVPNATPYVTSYYDREWGFCLPHSTYETLPEGEYHAYIDSEFVDGRLPFGHTTLEGKSEEEVLLSSYLCHPSMANNELSGPLVLSMLYNRIKRWNKQHYTYRFVLAPETIGSLCYLDKYGEHLQQHLVSGAVLTCLGGPADSLRYQYSRNGSSLLDKVIRNQSNYGKPPIRTTEFTPINGSDERQYCSPGFDLPVGQFARTVYGEYDGYHNSNDTKEFMTIDALVRSADEIESVLTTLKIGESFRNTEPYGEPMLSKYDLYPSRNAPETRGDSTDNIVNDNRRFLNAVLRILNRSDGKERMVDIANRHNYSLSEIAPIVAKLRRKGLLQRESEHNL
jgi:aminopeptidase-like protein